MSEHKTGASPEGSDDYLPGMRVPGSFAGKAAFWVGVILSLGHIWLNTLSTWPTLWITVFHFAGFGLLCALLYPAYRAQSRRSSAVCLALDLFLGLACLTLFAYLVIGEQAFYARTMRFEWWDWVFTSLAVLLAIEFIRRTTGWVVPILMILAFTYVTFWGKHVTGMLTFPGLSSDIMLFRSFYADDGMFGGIALISASYVFMFILFGAFLIRSGAGDFIIDLARVLASRTTGGPGIVAVMGSALMGTISGSAVANTVSTGSITIPLMKKSGYSAKFAAGVETAASTGGQLMPPIMGAGAFVMASYTQIPYATIAAVSIIPALLYFLSVLFYVRINAKKLNLVTEDQDVKPLKQVLRDGGLTFILPISVLVGMLIAGFTPTYAAGVSILTVVVASWLSPVKSNRMYLQAVLEALAIGARNMTMTAVLLCGIGLVVNGVSMTGIGNTFSLMIADWSGNSVFIAMVLIALASLVLGMGLPVTAAYIVLATLSAPALASLIMNNQIIDALMSGQIPAETMAVFMLIAPEHAASLGGPIPRELAQTLLAAVPLDMSRMLTEQILTTAAITTALLSAHMIIFWLSQDSNVTPPVCLTAFAAAAIARSPPMQTGLVSWRLAKGLYIVPFLFAYTPLLAGNLIEGLQVAFFATLGLYCFAAAFEGFMESKLRLYERLLLAGLFICFMWPGVPLVHLAALVVFVPLLILNIRADRRAIKTAVSGPSP